MSGSGVWSTKQALRKYGHERAVKPGRWPETVIAICRNGPRPGRALDVPHFWSFGFSLI